MINLIKIKEWIKNPKNQRNLLIVIILFLIFLLRECTPSKSDLNSLNQNVFALQDSIRTYKTKNDKLIFEKGAFITEKSSLESLNKELFDAIKYLKDHPIIVIKPEIRIVEVPKYIPIYIGDSTKNADGSISRTLNWAYDTTYSKGNYRKIEGNFLATVDSSLNLKTTPMHIKKDEIGMSLSTGFTENKEGKLEIFVTSDYPGFSVTGLNGALIDPEKSDILKKYFPKKRWGLGFYGGYGVYFNPRNLTVGSGLQIGLGIQYNFLQWNFKK